MRLASAYLFQELNQATSDEVAKIAVEESHPEGSFLFRAGEPASGLYILQEGRVRLSVERTGHLAHIVSDPGEAIGWSSMVDNEEYTASAECLVPVQVTRIDRDQLNRILEQDPASGLKFFRRLATLIGKRLLESYGGTLSVHARHDPRSYG